MLRNHPIFLNDLRLGTVGTVLVYFFDVQCYLPVNKQIYYKDKKRGSTNMPGPEHRHEHDVIVGLWMIVAI